MKYSCCVDSWKMFKLLIIECHLGARCSTVAIANIPDGSTMVIANTPDGGTDYYDQCQHLDSIVVSVVIPHIYCLLALLAFQSKTLPYIVLHVYKKYCDFFVYT